MQVSLDSMTAIAYPAALLHESTRICYVLIPIHVVGQVEAKLIAGQPQT